MLDWLVYISATFRIVLNKDRSQEPGVKAVDKDPGITTEWGTTNQSTE